MTSDAQYQNRVVKDSRIEDYEILENGDTINRMDYLNRKFGQWIEITKGKYGEHDIIENGNYMDNIKTGIWKTFTIDGRILSQEFFHKGRKSGEAKYFDEGNLYCIGNYLALKAEYNYDTIMVEDPISNTIRPVILKANLGSVRHGSWTYFNTQTHEVKRVVEYQADEIISDKEFESKVDSVYAEQRNKSFEKGTPPPNVMMLEKNKKASRFTEFPANMQNVKPNIRQTSQKK